MSKIIRIFSRVVRKRLQPVFVQISNDLQLRHLDSRFEQLYDISYTKESLDGLHIHVLALVVGKEKYFCRKFIHS